MTWLRLRACLPIVLAALAAAAPIRAQQPAPSEAPRVSVSFDAAAMPDVLAFFSRYSGRSIVAGAGVGGTVTASIDNQPWDRALDALLQTNGLYARELETGIIVVEKPAAAAVSTVPLVSRVFRLSFTPAAELEPVVRTMLTARGTVASVPSVNALVVTDEQRVIDRVAALLGK